MVPINVACATVHVSAEYSTTAYYTPSCSATSSTLAPTLRPLASRRLTVSPSRLSPFVALSRLTLSPSRPILAPSPRRPRPAPSPSPSHARDRATPSRPGPRPLPPSPLCVRAPLGGLRSAGQSESELHAASSGFFDRLLGGIIEVVALQPVGKASGAVSAGNDTRARGWLTS